MVFMEMSIARGIGAIIAGLILVPLVLGVVLSPILVAAAWSVGWISFEAAVLVLLVMITYFNSA